MCKIDHVTRLKRNVCKKEKEKWIAQKIKKASPLQILVADLNSLLFQIFLGGSCLGTTALVT